MADGGRRTSTRIEPQDRVGRLSLLPGHAERDGQDGQSLDESLWRCIGLGKQVSKSTDRGNDASRTLWICPKSFGVNFAQAEAATLPSGGNSAVIVLSAGTIVRKWDYECKRAANQAQRCLSVLRLCHQRTQSACPLPTPSGFDAGS